MTDERDAFLLTVGDVFFADIVTPGTSTTAPEYGDTVYRKTIAKKVEMKGNGKSTAIYASGTLVATVNQENGIEISMDMIGLSTGVLDMISGVTRNKGVAFTSADATTAKEFAFGLTAKKSDGIEEAMWFPRCSLSPATELSYETSEDEFKEQDVSVTIEASGLLNGDHIITTKLSNQVDDSLTVDDFMKAPIYDKSQLDALNSASTPTHSVTGVTLTPDTVSVETGQTTQLTGVVQPSNATDKSITYTSSDETIATVDESGLVTGLAAGTATITGKSGDQTATAAVTVTAAAEG